MNTSKQTVEAIWSNAGIHAKFDSDGVDTELGPVVAEDGELEEALSVVDHVLEQ